jgi:hypothetical protein
MNFKVEKKCQRRLDRLPSTTIINRYADTSVGTTEAQVPTR